MLNISKELYDSVPKLKPGERVVFKLLGVRYDKQLKRIVCPNSVRIPSIDRIWDKFSKEWVDMSLIESIVPNQDPASLRKDIITLRDIYFRREGRGEIVFWETQSQTKNCMSTCT